MALGACGGGDDDAATDNASAPTSASPAPAPEPKPEMAAEGATLLDVDYSVITVEPGQRRSFGFQALKAGASTPISLSGAGGCFSTSTAGAEIVVTGGNAPCSGVFTVAADGVDGKATVTVNVAERDSLDVGNGLLMRYTDQFDEKWTAAGGRLRNPLGFYHPKGPDGYYALGTLILRHNSLPKDKVLAVVVKDSQNKGLLAAPTGFTKLWDDAGSRVSRGISLWQVNCPNNYVAMGTVAAESEPSNTSVRCVKRDLAIPGQQAAEVTSTAGTEKDGFIAFGLTSPRIQTGDLTPFSVGSTTLKMDKDQKLVPGYLLGIRTSTYEVRSERFDLRLTSCAPIPSSEFSKSYAANSTRVPFTMLPWTDISENFSNAKSSPFYVLQRSTSYGPMEPSSRDNCASRSPMRVTATSTKGTSQTSETHISVDYGISTTITEGASAGVEGVSSASTSLSVTMSLNLGWSNTESKMYSTETSVEDCKVVPAGSIGQWLQTVTQFNAINADGQISEALEFGMDDVKYLEYNKDGNSADSC
ncbi:Vps62-related protein [Frankia sp. EI5c]|uniref:Vps62-related protein n=1 Tax=Frankia sp. EI5c TaxID=683316 RepID=UPI0018FE67FE|nr:Vps62-related protein [Frankia sp. EI5c]